MITSHSRGHKIIFTNNKWVYADDKTSIEIERPCIRCGKMPINGHDACIANLPNVISACCGHGIETGYMKFKDDIFKILNEEV